MGGIYEFPAKEADESLNDYRNPFTFALTAGKAASGNVGAEPVQPRQ